jgi:CBS-domain-containing membrane protein
MAKDKIIIVDDPISTKPRNPKMTKKILNWFKTIEPHIAILKTRFREDDLIQTLHMVGEVTNVDPDDPDFDLPGDDVGDK